MFNSKPALCRVQKNRGVSLIIVLIMMVIIGLTAASAMRNATSEQRATNNLRSDNLAQQYAEAALRYCEAQLKLADASRVATLKGSLIPTSTSANPSWGQSVTWVGTPGSGGASATRTAIPQSSIQTASLSSFVPSKLPECVAETQSMGSPSFTVTVITARGFSPDYVANGSGTTTQGAVVWLQSILNCDTSGGALCP